MGRERGKGRRLDRTLKIIGGRALASNNFAKNVTDPDCNQHGRDRVITDERFDLIMGIARLIDLPLNRLADIGDSSFWSVTHIPLSLTDRIAFNEGPRLGMLAASLSA
jgi:hypothetical protein